MWNLVLLLHICFFLLILHFRVNWVFITVISDVLSISWFVVVMQKPFWFVIKRIHPSRVRLTELLARAVCDFWTLAANLSITWNAFASCCVWFLEDMQCLCRYLNRNLLLGTIPKQIGMLKNLTVLNLSMNRFTGPIPVELGDLVSVTKM